MKKYETANAAQRLLARVFLEQPAGFRLELGSAPFHHQVLWHFQGLKVRGDDNYVVLYPGVPRIIAFEAEGSPSLKKLREALSVRSLVDSYA